MATEMSKLVAVVLEAEALEMPIKTSRFVVGYQSETLLHSVFAEKLISFATGA